MTATEEWIRRRLPVIEPPGPTVTINLSLLQAIDLHEAYKAARFCRGHTAEVSRLLGDAIRHAYKAVP